MRTRTLLCLVLVAAACACGRPSDVLVGAVYPTGGSQGPGGIEEYRGVQLAAERAGGVRLVPVPADTVDGAAPAVRRLHEQGVQLVVGSYGSVISKPASEQASRLGMLYWETGAVGMLERQPRDLVFRFPATGQVLGRNAISFIDPLVAKGAPLRYAVTWVDDVYGSSVAQGAIDELEARGLNVVAKLPYTMPGADLTSIARRVAEAQTDVLVVSAYLEDGIALRRALVDLRVPLKASIGTSSSYCMREFGKALGDRAVGLFASDKPSGDVMDLTQLSPAAADALRWARDEYRRRYRDTMTAPALTGFAAGWALFHHVLPKASSAEPRDVAAAARSLRLPSGALPNGSGLRFGSTGENLAANSVIWEWVRPNTRAVVWPPEMASEPPTLLPIA